MDEILIEEKRYISSKQAAKITGYAKDYIGQLCREGRVPARLVGRSWYVLESAIHDHRFGNPKSEPSEALKLAPTETPAHSTWESPRYEASELEILPSVNRPQVKESSSEPIHDQHNDPEVAQRLQDTWQAWFDRFDDKAAEPATIGPEAVREEEIEEPEKEEPAGIEENVNIPIHAVREPQYSPAPRELLPHYPDLGEAMPDQDTGQQSTVEIEELKRGGRLPRTVQTVGAIVALIAVSLAILGSGYFDKYIESYSQVGLISGLQIYNK